MRPRTFYLCDCLYEALNDLVSRGYFLSPSEAVRCSIINMLGDMAYLKEKQMQLRVSGSPQPTLVTIRMPEFLAEASRELARQLGYKSRSEFMRLLIVQALMKYAKSGGKLE
ncbi:MAG: ribbon-helix-helix domain-containing protein [Nitrososphaerota archaeon]